MNIYMTAIESGIIATCDHPQLKPLAIKWTVHNEINDIEYIVQLKDKTFRLDSIDPIALVIDAMACQKTFEQNFEQLLKKSNLVKLKNELKELASFLNNEKNVLEVSMDEDFRLYEQYKEKVRQHKETLNSYTVMKQQIKDIVGNMNIGKGRPALND